MCPNCRQDADLEAPVDVETETWEAILQTTDPRTPTVEGGANRDPQINVVKFQPFPDISPQLVAQTESRLVNDVQNLTLTVTNEGDRNSRTSPDRELSLSRTLSPALPPIIENHIQQARPSNSLATPPIGILRRGRAISATREGLEDRASLSATPTIDQGPFVYGDMTVNADGSAEATTSTGDVVQLPRESVSEDGNQFATKSFP
jgi:hypothetical protein